MRAQPGMGMLTGPSGIISAGSWPLHFNGSTTYFGIAFSRPSHQGTSRTISGSKRQARE